MENAETQAANNGKAKPILLRDVIRIDKGTDAWPNAILVDSGSVIEFYIRSRGPYGFMYRLTTDNETIVDGLYYSDSSGSGNDATLSCRRQQSDQSSTLRVDSFRSKGLTTTEQKTRYWSCNIQTWRLLGFEQPQGTKLGASRGGVEARVEGGALDTIGPKSTTTFGTIWNPNTESSPNGYLRVFFFVFADPQAKSEFCQAYADANPDDF